MNRNALRKYHDTNLKYNKMILTSILIVVKNIGTLEQLEPSRLKIKIVKEVSLF